MRRCPSANPRQLFSDQHVHQTRATEGCAQGDAACGGGEGLADDAGPCPFGSGEKGGDNGIGLIVRAKQHQTAFIGQIQRVKAQYLADPGHLGAQGQAGFVDLNRSVRNGMLSPIDFEQQQKLKLQGV